MIQRSILYSSATLGFALGLGNIILHLLLASKDNGQEISRLFIVQINNIFFLSTVNGLTLRRNSDPRIQSSLILSSMYRDKTSGILVICIGKYSTLPVRENGVPSIAEP